MAGCMKELSLFHICSSNYPEIMAVSVQVHL